MLLTALRILLVKDGLTLHHDASMCSASRPGYGWEQPADGPLRPAPARDPLQLPQGPTAGWPWERGFAEALVHWASALQWIPGSGQFTYAELQLRQ